MSRAHTQYTMGGAPNIPKHPRFPKVTVSVSPYRPDSLPEPEPARDARAPREEESAVGWGGSVALAGSDPLAKLQADVGEGTGAQWQLGPKGRQPPFSGSQG